jgi:hypothetical protein
MKKDVATPPQETEMKNPTHGPKTFGRKTQDSGRKKSLEMKKKILKRRDEDKVPTKQHPKFYGVVRSNFSQYAWNRQIASWMPSMLVKTLLVATSLTIYCICEAVAEQPKPDANTFDCAFLYEKFKGGKSGQAACGYTGKGVWAEVDFPPPAGEHCKTEKVFSYDDLTNFVIDRARNTVRWNQQHGLAPFAIPGAIEHYMRTEKLSRQEATEKANRVRTDFYFGKIFHVSQLNEEKWIDEITNQVIPPRKYPVYLITFGGTTSQNHSIFIYERNNDAILTSYSGDADYSGVKLRFGKCRRRDD